jgi:hydroxymethylbilane synthase
VGSFLRSRFPGVAVEVLEMTTTGDRQTDWSLEQKGGKGLFTKELENALLDGRADCAVHSAKDLPTRLPGGLVLAGFLPRESAHDVLVVREGCGLPKTIATGSPRRRAQGQLLFPQTAWREIRGNVETRLEKIARGDADATILAAAGLKRLGLNAWRGVVFRPLPLTQMVPAAGQGAIAVECSEDRQAFFEGIFDAVTGKAVRIERRFLDLLGGGCDSSQAGHFCNDELLIYHEACGFQRFPFYGCTSAGLDEKVASIVASLGL